MIVGSRAATVDRHYDVKVTSGRPGGRTLKGLTATGRDSCVVAANKARLAMQGLLLLADGRHLYTNKRYSTMHACRRRRTTMIITLRLQSIRPLIATFCTSDSASAGHCARCICLLTYLPPQLGHRHCRILPQSNRWCIRIQSFGYHDNYNNYNVMNT